MLPRGGFFPETEKTYVRARQLCEQLEDPPLLVNVLHGLASLYEVRGEYETSQSVMEERLRLPKDWQGGKLLIESHDLLACSLFHQGIFTKSLAHAEKGLQLYDPGEFSILMAPYGEHPAVNCRDWAALDLWFMGYPDRALKLALEALGMAHKPGHLYSLTSAQILGAFLYQFRREEKQARELSEAIIEIAEKQGYPYRIAQANILSGWAMAFAGEGQEGIKRIRRGLNGLASIGAMLDYAYFLALLAEAYSASDRVLEGLDAINAAQDMIRNTRSFFYEAELHRLKGALIWQSGIHDGEAKECIMQALKVARRQKAKTLELRSAVSLGRNIFKEGPKQKSPGSVRNRFITPLKKDLTPGICWKRNCC